MQAGSLSMKAETNAQFYRNKSTAEILNLNIKGSYDEAKYKKTLKIRYLSCIGAQGIVTQLAG